MISCPLTWKCKAIILAQRNQVLYLYNFVSEKERLGGNRSYALSHKQVNYNNHIFFSNHYRPLTHPVHSCEWSIRKYSNNFHPSWSFTSCFTSFLLVRPRSFHSASTVLHVITLTYLLFFFPSPYIPFNPQKFNWQLLIHLKELEFIKNNPEESRIGVFVSWCCPFGRLQKISLPTII